jgi:anti-sigma regulatory factor (Ser/Thr protein kinase)/anti-anti-sigma regulatory factor
MRENDRFQLTVPDVLQPDTPADFERRLETLLRQAPEVIALDCADVDHLSSSHVKLLWGARARCAQAGVTVCLTAASPYIWKVLKVLDLADFFIRDEEAEGRPHPAEPMELLVALDVYEDTFRAGTAEIDSALQRFLNTLRETGVPQNAQYVLRTIFYEIATNVRLHASGEEPGTIAFSAIPDRHKIVLTFVDTGPPFNPLEFEVDAEPRRETADERRAFGIAIVKKLADRMFYKRLDDRENALIVERAWRMPQWSKTPSRNVP